jgi:hypothetical protein
MRLVGEKSKTRTVRNGAGRLAIRITRATVLIILMLDHIAHCGWHGLYFVFPGRPFRGSFNHVLPRK